MKNVTLHECFQVITHLIFELVLNRDTIPRDARTIADQTQDLVHSNNAKNIDLARLMSILRILKEERVIDSTLRPLNLENYYTIYCYLSYKRNKSNDYTKMINDKEGE